MTTSFITTAIPFVNARPHLGFAYELVLADALARHRRRRGRDVRFLTGTDDNSLKNVLAAARENLSPRELVDRNAAAFADLGPLLDVVPDDFIRTSADPRHRPGVDWLWRACAARGDLYQRTWEGRYCGGCEAFVDDTVDICAEHLTAPEPVRELNWFFRLSRYRDAIRDAVTSGQLAIISDAARAETLAFLDGDVRDLSVSRPASRSAGWGIPVPDDPTQVIYVWFDALANYISSLGLGGDETLLDRYWRSGERLHVIGKGISRFHAVYWPAFLLSAGLPLPDRILVHGYLTVDKHKLSKSGRNLDVAPVVAETGVDALRWFFVRRCRTRGDTDVSSSAILAAYDADLADGLGNLVQRCTTLLAHVADGVITRNASESANDARLRALAEALPARVDAAVDAFLLDDAVAAIIELIDEANRTLERTEPWRLARTDPGSATALLYAPLESARIAAAELAPFIPGVARAIAHRLGDPPDHPRWGGLAHGARIGRGDPVLPRKTRSAA